MPPSLLMNLLALARRQVVQGRDHISRQREIVADLERDGHDPSAARRILARYQERPALYVAERDRLESLAQNPR